MPAWKTYPTEEQLAVLKRAVPQSMRPSDLPTAGYVEGYLSSDQCERIVDRVMKTSPHHFKKCKAETRELDLYLGPELEYVRELTWVINQVYWSFDLDAKPTSWMQTYYEGNSYQMHQDTSPGYNRKLTAVVLLSPREQYLGGALTIHLGDIQWEVPDEQGTVVVFPSWINHSVTEVSSGVRQTINMGFHGPAFK
jgi:hypothetical protein